MCIDGTDCIHSTHWHSVYVCCFGGTMFEANERALPNCVVCVVHSRCVYVQWMLFDLKKKGNGTVWVLMRYIQIKEEFSIKKKESILRQCSWKIRAIRLHQRRRSADWRNCVQPKNCVVKNKTEIVFVKKTRILPNFGRKSINFYQSNQSVCILNLFKICSNFTTQIDCLSRKKWNEKK